MVTEVWVQRPRLCIRECAAERVDRIVWNRGSLVKYAIEPQRHFEAHYPPDINYRILVVSGMGTLEVTPDTSMQKPRAIYPTWTFGKHRLDELEAWIDDPGRAGARYGRLAPDPHKQEHRIVIGFFGERDKDLRRKALRDMAAIQRDHPECILHVHGLYDFREQFGLGFRSADVDPTITQRFGEVYLGNGKTIKAADAARWQQWVNLVGLRVSDLDSLQNCMVLNIRSAMWAGESFDKLVKFKVGAGGERVDPMQPMATPRESKSIYSKAIAAEIGDKFACDFCSLERTCKYFRVGGVCAVPGSETKPLIELIKSRDTDQIIEGLTGVLAVNIERMEEGREAEKAEGRLNPEVTKIVDSVVAGVVKLAKLRNPRLNGPGIKIGVGVGVGVGALPAGGGSTPQLAAAIYNELLDRGIAAEDITEEMVLGQIRSRARAIEVSTADG